MTRCTPSSTWRSCSVTWTKRWSKSRRWPTCAAARSIGAFIVLDEAQNTTAEQMFMFLTRLGQGSKCVVTGDRTQIDLPANKRSGLVEASQALKDVPGIGFAYFEESDVVRHELVQAIIRAYRLHRYGEQPPGVPEERGRRKN